MERSERVVVFEFEIEVLRSRLQKNGLRTAFLNSLENENVTIETETEEEQLTAKK